MLRTGLRGAARLRAARRQDHDAVKVRVQMIAGQERDAGELDRDMGCADAALEALARGVADGLDADFGFHVLSLHLTAFMLVCNCRRPGH